MPMIKRHAISRHNETGVEYYDGCGFWSDLREDAEEYRTLEAAEEEAATVGGEVFSYERFSDIADQFVTPIISLVPASEPVWRGHNSSGRLQYREAERMEAVL